MYYTSTAWGIPQKIKKTSARIVGAPSKIRTEFMSSCYIGLKSNHISTLAEMKQDSLGCITTARNYIRIKILFSDWTHVCQEDRLYLQQNINLFWPNMNIQRDQLQYKFGKLFQTVPFHPNVYKVKLLLSTCVNAIKFTKILARRIGVAEETFLSKELNGFINYWQEGLPVEVTDKLRQYNLETHMLFLDKEKAFIINSKLWHILQIQYFQTPL